ncbi:methylated-DNA--[protein]-cysteine S-methyltransferase [Peptoniphilus sp.]|jgi:methylated-DNA-[protein]-cysteine S-methyltransferase|uniref:methylated-DNA--[protein]-cysteine S-methyltransferase n=1 Tax=Peptoniphilus sp. TaxID=1971214 RepID=UPI003D8D94CE
MEYIKNINSKIGNLLLSSDGDALTGLWIVDQKYFARTLGDEYKESDLKIFRDTEEWLGRYFSGKRPSPSELKLNPRGSEFQKAVWNILVNIPYGEVITYGEIAQEMAKLRGKKKMAAQAVGGAVGHNPISIIIPCHRVVGKGKRLTGYASGIDNKITLLELEGVDLLGYTL